MIQKIHSISEAELDQIMAIWLEANIEAHPFVAKKYWLDNQEEVRKALPQADLYVYQNDHEICGFLGIMDGYIAGIFVKNKYRRQKIGQKLLNLAKADHEELTLAVYEKNEAAYRFYLRENFVSENLSIDTENHENEYLMKWKK